LDCGWQQRATWSLCCPSPHWVGDENGKKKRQKLMGWDKGSSTEQEMKGIETIIILIRRIYKTNS